jgi:superfamily II DNA or RNA helicase
MIHFQLRPPCEARAAIAAAILPPSASPDERLGDVTLRSRQRVAADRLTSLIRDHGGAMLADPVGLGKTYAALAVAARFPGRTTIVAPASLRAMWGASIATCHSNALVVSHESLSRGVLPGLSNGLVIVDEAHRFRSASTKRYATLAGALAGALAGVSLLLVSATPMQNRRGDLCAQLALFLGRRAWSMSDDELAVHVVRTNDLDSAEQLALPDLNGPVPISLGADDDCLDHILALPPPIAARDASVAATLLTYGLVHQWSSSRAALVAALRRRRSHGLALLAAFDAGRYPTRAELSAWTHLDDAVQLAFPELVVETSVPDVERGDLAIAIDRHLAAVDALLGRCRSSPDPDEERASLLAHLMDVHHGERIIAFCHYTETVEAVRRHLANRPGIATLTARGARVASGRVSRELVLSQFTPAVSARRVDAAQRIDLLVATDLLSEGLNLQEASVVVHLDLPWNPARLDQRVGRARRLGSRHRVVTVYSFAPPTSAERMLRIHDRLREKLSLAQRAIGVAGRILPAFVTPEPPAIARSLAEQASVVDRSLREWATAGADVASIPVVGVVAGPVDGFIAAVRDAGVPRIIADIGHGVGTDGRSIERAIALANGPATTADTLLIAKLLERVGAHLRTLRASAFIDFAAAASARSRRATLARVDKALARTPRHKRALIAPLIDAARAVATTPLGAGAERVLDTLVQSDLPDEAWLRSITTFGELNARPVAARPSGMEIVAVVAFVRRRA